MNKQPNKPIVLNIPKPKIASTEIPQSEDQQLQRYLIPLDGKLITAQDPSQIGKNFRSLVNMRYRDTYPEGIMGMTKINSSALSTYPWVRKAFHFTVENSNESHVLMQAKSSDGGNPAVIDDSAVIQLTTAIPNSGNVTETVLWDDSSISADGYFSAAPGGTMAYCNGDETCLWGGDETFCSALITSSATVTTATTNTRDYSEIVNNDSQSGDNIIIVGGGIDAYTKLCLHFDGADASTTFTDSSTGGKSVTAISGTDTCLDTDQAKFGTASLMVPGGAGGSEGITTADSADWNMGTGAFTIDFWLKVNAYPATYAGLFQQYVSNTNVARLFIGASGELVFQINNTTPQLAIATSAGAISGTDWHHVALIRGIGGVANAWWITVDGNVAANGSAVSATNWHDIGAAFQIGTLTGYESLNGWIEEFTVSKGIARWTTAFTPPTRAYLPASTTFLVGSLRPLKGVKFYIADGGGNTVDSTLTGSTWNGYSWQTLTLTDGTDTGASLAQTGLVSFDSTVGISQLKYIDGYLLYWYQFTLDAGNATIYKVALDAPFQEIVDIWDGYERFCASFYLYKAAYNDFWINVYNDDYVSSDTSTFAELDALTATSQYMLIGFSEKMSGINISIAPSHFNTTAATVAAVEFWNGIAFETVGSISDGTADGGISLAKSGVIYWNQSSLSAETKRVIKGGYPLYYYKVVFDKNLSADVQVYYISGIPSPNDLRGYSYPVHAADRLMLLGNTDEYANKLLISAEQAPQVMNGDNHFEIFIGDDKPLLGGCAMFAQFASNLYNMVLLFKNTQTWMLTWVNSSEGTVWERYMISDTVGCPSPATIHTSSVSFDGSINQTRNIAIWQSHDGIYISDGRTPLSVSTDIEDVFDQTSTTHINLAMIHKSRGFLDKRRNEYHWLWASGTSTTLDKEYVLDLKRWKWYIVQRGAGNELQCGVNVSDAYGNNYTYGFIDTGYIEYLEHGTDFDGTDITHELHTGDQLLIENDIFTQTRVEKVILVALSKNTDTVATVTNYLDGATAGSDHTIATNDSTHRITQIVSDVHSDPAVFHSLKIVMATDQETKGLVPMFAGVYYIPEREHLK